MIRTWIAGACVVGLVHTIAYWWRVRRIRQAEDMRRRVTAQGIVPGADSIICRGSSTHAALLIHGFGDTPQSMQLLAEYLCATHGWTVHVPLLSGHGRTLAMYDAVTASAWKADVHREYAALRATHPVVVLVGLSMGGALATMEAAQHADLPALVLIAPYLTPPATAQRLAPLAGIINVLVPYLRGGDRVRSIFDPVARAESLGAW